MLKQIKKINKVLFSIFLLALVFRFTGITNGFPFIYNVDEPALVRSAYHIRFEANPKHFDWPHLHFYLNFFVFGIIYIFRGFLQVIGLRWWFESSFPILWKDPLIFYLSARSLNALLGSLTIIPVYLIAKNLFNKKIGLLSALAFAIFPYHVWSSHFALIDVPMVFWFTWSVYFSTQILKNNNKKYYMLAGLFAGFAMSTKYNGAFAFSIILFAHALYMFKDGLFKHKLVTLLLSGRFLVLSFILLICGFLIGTPFAALDFKTFSRTDGPKGALWQFENVGKVSGSEYAEQLQQVLTYRFTRDLSPVYIIIFELFIIYFLFSKKTLSKAFIAIPALFYVLYVTSFDKNRIHYYMISFPFISIMVGYFIYTVAATLEPVLRSKIKLNLRLNLLVYLFAALVFAWPLYNCLGYLKLLLATDTRNDVYGWITSQIPTNTYIVYKGGDLQALFEGSKYNVKKLSNLDLITRKNLPTYVIVSKQNAKERDSENSKELKKLETYYNLTSYFDNKEKLGPEIEVYKLKDNLEQETSNE